MFAFFVYRIGHPTNTTTLISELELRSCLWKKEDDCFKNKIKHAEAQKEIAGLANATVVDEAMDKI